MPDDRYQTGGLHNVLRLATGSCIALVKNIDTSDGLVNGAIGIIQHMELKAIYHYKTLYLLSSKTKTLAVNLNPHYHKKFEIWMRYPIVQPQFASLFDLKTLCLLIELNIR